MLQPWLPGMELTADRLNQVGPYARYARTGGTQPLNTTTRLVEWPNAIEPNSLVTPQGTNNIYFAVQPGMWFISASVRRGSQFASTDLFLVTSTTGQPVEVGGSRRLGSGGASLNAGVSDVLIFTSVTYVGIMAFSSTSDTIVAKDDACSITLARMA